MSLLMLHTRSTIYRITYQRPLRPPCILRLRLLTVATKTRLQLPLLTPRTLLFPPKAPLRPLSTSKRRANTASQLRLVAYALLIAWAASATLSISRGFLREFWLDRIYPSPQDWRFTMKHHWRLAQHEIVNDKFGKDTANWAGVGDDFHILIEYALRDPEVKPYSGTEGETVPGIAQYSGQSNSTVSTKGLPVRGEDITAKSEEWRRAYFDVWMGYALAAERNYGWVRDTTRRLAFPQSQMVGPSNPYPQPVWSGSPPAPLEENCEPCFEPPSFFYTHILTSKGFSASQRIAAALNWASWLDYQDDTATAAELNSWALDLAITSLKAEGGDPDQIIDRQTDIIKPTATFITPNILKATTSLASFKARHNELSAALNIYISVLRARRDAPTSPPGTQYAPHPPSISITSFANISRFFRSLLHSTSMPPSPGSGNEPYTRTQASKCDEAAVMAHMGEILFATGEQSAGLSWTRDAADLAEQGFNDVKLDPYSRISCAQCVDAALNNWLRMTSTLVAEQQVRETVDADGNVVERGPKGWLAWIKSLLGPRTASQALVDAGDWRVEHELVEARRAAFLEMRMEREMNGKSGPFL